MRLELRVTFTSLPKDRSLRFADPLGLKKVQKKFVGLKSEGPAWWPGLLFTFCFYFIKWHITNAHFFLRRYVVLPALVTGSWLIIEG